jgi:hypothetical protein
VLIAVGVSFGEYRTFNFKERDGEVFMVSKFEFCGLEGGAPDPDFYTFINEVVVLLDK